MSCHHQTASSIKQKLYNFRKEFVDLYIEFVFNKSVEKQYKGFHDGFHKVCGGRVMKLFKPHELMAVVVGNEDYNWDEFETHAEYKNGYTSSDITVRMFWEVFHELSLEDKKKFLLFLTGSDRIPIQGMKGIKVTTTRFPFIQNIHLYALILDIYSACYRRQPPLRRPHLF